MDGHFIVPGLEGDAVPARGPSTWRTAEVSTGKATVPFLLEISGVDVPWFGLRLELGRQFCPKAGRRVLLPKILLPLGQCIFF